MSVYDKFFKGPVDPQFFKLSRFRGHITQTMYRSGSRRISLMCGRILSNYERDYPQLAHLVWDYYRPGFADMGLHIVYLRGDDKCSLAQARALLSLKPRIIRCLQVLGIDGSSRGVLKIGIEEGIIHFKDSTFDFEIYCMKQDLSPTHITNNQANETRN